MALGASPVERLAENVRRAEFRREGLVEVQKEDLKALLEWADNAARLIERHAGNNHVIERWREISGCK